MPAEPRQFGPYRLIRRLGVGGMAEAFEAARVGSSGFEQRVCLKRILPAYGEDEELVRRFRHEAQLAARLRHTNIVGILDVGAIDGVHYMALELVDGVDLRSFLRSSKGEKLSAEVVALIAMDLAYALDHAHGALVHRDLSPSNVLVSRTGEAKLADFGVAKALEATAATASRHARGKIPYMAPEQMRGEAVDGRADLFSLGVVMFEALAGQRPFDGAHEVETMQRILDGKRPALAEVAPDTPAALVAIVERLLETDREARYANASELLEALADVAPNPGVRRGLAATVEGYRGGPEARLHVRVGEDAEDTDLMSTPVPGAPSRANEPPPERRGKMGLLLGGLAALVAAALWVVAPEGAAPEDPGIAAPPPVAQATAPSTSPMAPTTAARPPVSPEPVPEDPQSLDEPGSLAHTVKVAEPPPTRVGRGRLRVIVQPWGNVWVDGDYMGRAPLTVRLREGTHRVSVGRELPSKTRVVRVQPGARKEIVMRLGAE
jgi:hypothetical protein